MFCVTSWFYNTHETLTSINNRNARFAFQLMNADSVLMFYRIFHLHQFINIFNLFWIFFNKNSILSSCFTILRAWRECCCLLLNYHCLYVFWLCLYINSLFALGCCACIGRVRVSVNRDWADFRTSTYFTNNYSQFFHYKLSHFIQFWIIIYLMIFFHIHIKIILLFLFVCWFELVEYLHCSMCTIQMRFSIWCLSNFTPVIDSASIQTMMVYVTDFQDLPYRQLKCVCFYCSGMCSL